MRKEAKKKEQAVDVFLLEELGVDMEEFKSLKKKLAKVEPRAERGAETLFR